MSAAVASVAVGVGGLALGYASYEESRKAGNKAASAAGGQLQFSVQQYNDWKAIYGPIEENLGQYYKTLNPDTFAALNINAIQTEYAKTKENMDRELKIRGITPDSGVGVGTMLDLETRRAAAAAAARVNAPQQVAQMQQGFLAQGQGNNPATMVGTAYGNTAQFYENRAAVGGQGVGYGISAVGGALQNYMTYDAMQKNPAVAPNQYQLPAPTYTNV